MKEILLLCSCIIIVQQLAGQNVENKPQHFGFKTGASYSLMNFNKAFQRPDPPVKNIWKKGFYAGASLLFPLNKKFLLQPEYQYSRMTGYDERISTSYHFDYLSLPLLVKVKVYNKIHILLPLAVNSCLD
jgi:hypothetical protein